MERGYKYQKNVLIRFYTLDDHVESAYEIHRSPGKPYLLRLSETSVR